MGYVCLRTEQHPGSQMETQLLREDKSAASR